MVTDIIEGYKSTEIGKLPSDWDLKTVEEISSVTTGNKDTQDKIENGIYDFYVRSQKVEKINSYSFDGEAVLTAGDGVGVGKVFHYVKGKFDYHQRVYKISDFKNIEGKFFFYYFAENFIKQARKYNSKTSVDSVRRHMITEMKIPIPPIAEQKKIIEILSAADEQIEKTNQLIEKTKELKKGLMQKLLTKGINHNEFKKTGLGEIPAGWEIDNLENLTLKITDGAHHRPTYLEEGIPFLRVTDIQTREIHWNETKKISVEEHNALIKRCHPEKGDILLSKNGTIGLTKLIDWENEFSIFVSLCLIKVHKSNSKVLPEFLIPFFESSVCQRQFKDSSKQGTVTNLHLVEIRKLLIPLPSIEEQRKIADISLSIDNQIEAYEKEKEKQKQLKKVLLQKILTGEIRVTV